MKSNKLSDQGFAHVTALVAAAVVVALGGVFFAVMKAQNSKTKSSQTAAKSASSQSTNSKTAPKTADAASTAPSQSTSTTPTTSKSTAATKNTPAATNSINTTSSTPSSTPAPTPLSVLTALISDLKGGALVNITASSVSVPGPISTAQARPIVFTVSGQTYFAYRQGSAPNFTASAADTANTMAIVKASSNPSTVQAHLDKAGNLVDPSISMNLVAYSQGGN